MSIEKVNNLDTSETLFDFDGFWDRLLTAYPGWSVPEIAKELGYERQTLYKWRDGKAYPTIETLLYISKSTKSSLDHLLWGEKKKPSTEKELPLDADEREAVRKIAESAEDSFDVTIAMIVREWLFERGQLATIEDREILAPVYAMKEDLPQEKRHEIIGRMIERTLKIAAA